MFETLFDLIATDECKHAGRLQMEFPSLGEPDWPWTAPFIKKKKGRGPKPAKKDAKTFYDFWLNFKTGKSFEWAAPFEPYGDEPAKLKRWAICYYLLHRLS